jgi:glc operon protein GlcG
MKIQAATLTALLLIASGATAQAQVTDTRESIAYDGAKQIVDTCMTMARANHWPIAIWVLDISGQPVYFASMGARAIAVATAKMKGETALRTGNPSEAVNTSTSAGETSAIDLGLFPGAGGLPLMKDGKQIGAVGVGGARPENGKVFDSICGQAGIDAVFKK